MKKLDTSELGPVRINPDDQRRTANRVREALRATARQAGTKKVSQLAYDLAGYGSDQTMNILDKELEKRK